MYIRLIKKINPRSSVLIFSVLLLLAGAALGYELVRRRKIIFFKSELAPGFTTEVVAPDMEGATAIAWAPDGRIFIAHKSGRVSIFQNGRLLPEPFIDLSDEVNDYWERGLLDIALHPDFPNTPYVYLAFTYDPPGVVKDSKAERLSRVIRVSVDSNNPNQALAGSEVILLGKNSIRASIGDENLNDGTTAKGTSGPASCETDGKPMEDCLPIESRTHTIGTILFASDGSLYVGNGDGAETRYADPRALGSLDLDNLRGKLLRIDPITGDGYPDNPFYDGDPTHNRSKVLNYGLRNPYRFTIHPLTHELFIGDVGWHSWEEINVGGGKNFGWPCYEGDNTGSARQTEYATEPGTRDTCAALYAQSLTTIEKPIYAYFHSRQIAAIVLGEFYIGTLYPPEYQGALFFADYTQDEIKYLTFDAQGQATEHDFGRDLSPSGGPVQIVVGPDTNLYYVTFDGKRSQIRRIRYTGDRDYYNFGEIVFSP